MLPPVRAISGSDVSFQNQAAPQPQPQPVSAPRLPDQIDTRPNTANIFAKANIRALSSEMHLTQNTVSLTETLGKLLNMPRMDSEAAPAYSKRLVQALAALPAPQRAVLEQQLGKALQGLTLAMLVEVLKNPAGSDAARLSVLLEMSRFKGLDMATKAVVSSYKQNVGAEPPIAAAPRPATTVPAQLAPAPSTANSANAAAPAATALPAQGTVQTAPQLQTAPQTGQTPTNPATTQQIAPSAFADDAEQKATLTTSIPAPQAAEDYAEGTMQPKAAVASQMARVADAAPALTANPQKQTASAAAPPQPQQVAGGKQPSTEPHATLRQEMPVNVRDYSTLSARAEARLIAMIAQEQFQGATAKDIENLLLAALTGKLPKRADIGQPGLPPAFVAEEAAEFETKPQATSAQNAQSSAQAENEETAPATPRPEALVASRAAADTKAMMLDQPALHTALAAALVKEGIALPFVDYPIAKDEPESDAQHRGRWPSSGDEAEPEPEGEPQGQGDDQEERAAANDEGDAMTDELLEDEPHDSAEAYYLRMGGLA